MAFSGVPRCSTDTDLRRRGPLRIPYPAQQIRSRYSWRSAVDGTSRWTLWALPINHRAMAMARLSRYVRARHKTAEDLQNEGPYQLPAQCADPHRPAQRGSGLSLPPRIDGSDFSAIRISKMV